MAQPPSDELRIIRWPDVSQRIGYKSKAHIERLEKAGKFPKSVKLGARAKGWVLSEVNDWITARIADRDGGISHVL